MILGIDHILIAVEDLELAIETYQQLGLQVLPGGRHPNKGTHNAIVPLADGTYLELIGVFDQALAEQASPFVSAALHHENRLAQFALASDDLESDVIAIRARGIEIADPSAGERERPDGQKVAWRSAFPFDPQLPFLIQDVTPRALRVPAPDSGIGRTLRMGDVNVGVRDLVASTDIYQKLLGVDGEDGWFELPRGAIILKDVDTARLLQMVLEADNPLDIINTWQSRQVDYDESTIGGIGITLQPKNTLGAPIAITGRMS
ncbi:MAG TPA: VOC family protein [Anaerolineae bacterium]|nr:VOC family protein [Anaerolineae bacterium]